MKFQPPSRSLTPRDYQFIAFVVIVFLALSAGLVVANLSLPRGGGDFLVHWVGSRGFLFERIDPYSADVPTRTQEIVYGGSAPVGNEPFILDTPFHLLLLYFPFALLSDPQTARAIYTLFLELALFTLAILSVRLTNWETPRWFSILFIFFCVFNFYAFQAVMEASPVLLLGLAYAGILLAYQYEQDELVGALMAVSLYYWEVGLPFLLLIFWRSYKEKRVRVLFGFFMFTFILVAISLLLYPDWLIAYLRAGMNNLRVDFGFSTFEALTSLFPASGRIAAWTVIIVLILAIGYEWTAAEKGDDRRVYWFACLLLAAAPLLGFRTEMENLAVLVIPLALVFSVAYDRWNRIGGGLTFFLLLALFALPWAGYFFLAPRIGELTQQILFLFLPVLTILGLYWIRWWALRPPRLWADLAARQSTIAPKM